MEDRLELLKATIRESLSESRFPDRYQIGEDMLNLWSQYHERGVEAHHFARVAVLMANWVMSYHDSLEANARFGEYLKEAGVIKVRAVSTHWPPVDANDWPEAWPKDKFE